MRVKVGRHPQVAAIQASGVVAMTAPMFPTLMSSPSMVENSDLRNRWEIALMAGT